MPPPSHKYPTVCRVIHPKLKTTYALPKNCTQELFDDAMTFKPLPGDTFLVAFPKCGSTWVENAVTTMRNGGKALKEGEFVHDHIPFLDFVGAKSVDAVTERPRIIKSHFYFDVLPWNKEAKYIALARNPKDCITSYYHHTVGFENIYDFRQGKFDDFFDAFMKGDVPFGDYFRCTSEWWQKSKTEPNVLSVLYEDMKQDMGREFLRIADFMGPEWGMAVRAKENELLKKMVEECSFDKMKKNKNLLKFEGLFYRPDDKPFVRKGIVGDWKNIFSEDQSRIVDEKLKAVGLKHPGFDRLWDKYLD